MPTLYLIIHNNKQKNKNSQQNNMEKITKKTR